MASALASLYDAGPASQYDAEVLARLNLSNAEFNDVTILNARDDFGLFRRQIRKGMLWGWWTQEIAWQLQRFYNEMVEGKRPKLAISSPPQHGKSWAATDFIAWVAGKLPDRKTIFGSYSDDLGIRTNNYLQRIITSDIYRKIFPGTKISSETTSGFDRWKRNSSLIEFINHQGSFRNTTVSGQINGLELHLGVIDDPIKGREEARRVNARNKVWDWFSDDFLSRFAKDAALLVTMTRWDTDDLLGRYIARFPDVRMLSYPAIAEHDERYRRKGEPLFPELKPLDFLLDRKRLLTQPSWESIYQQHPIVVGGGQFPIEKLKMLPFFDTSKITNSIRYWDKASSDSEDSAFTAGVLMHAMSDGSFVISHVARGQWTALVREQKISDAVANVRNMRAGFRTTLTARSTAPRTVRAPTARPGPLKNGLADQLAVSWRAAPPMREPRSVSPTGCCFTVSVIIVSPARVPS